MDKGTQEEMNEESGESKSDWKVYWDSWYKRTRDMLLQLKATNKTQAALLGNPSLPATRKDVAIAIDWVGDCYDYLQTFVDVLDFFQKSIRKQEEQIAKITEIVMELTDYKEEHKDILEFMKTWVEEKRSEADEARRHGLTP